MARLAVLYEQNDLSKVGTELEALWELIQLDTSVEIIRHYLLSAQYYTSVGEFNLARNALQNLEEAASSLSAPDEQARAVGAGIRIYLRLGETQKPLAWLQSVDYDINNLTLLRNDEYLAVADALRFHHSPQRRHEGMKLVEALLKYCDDLQMYGTKIEVYCLQALLLASNDDVDGATQALEQALAAGEPEAYVRSFIDFGVPMAELLKEASARDIHAEYANSLLAQFTTTTKPRSNGDGASGLIEAISEREMDVLKLMVTHLSGPEIASQLHISVNTLKTHTRKIYNKLGVNSRNEAVEKAQGARPALINPDRVMTNHPVISHNLHRNNQYWEAVLPVSMFQP